jgi:NitT/TauT family transport system substrate-binding protein
MSKPLLTRRGLLAGMTLVATAKAEAADAIRVAALKTGTFGWELDVIGEHGLDREADLSVEALEFAAPQAAELALRAGQADIMISDWLYVSRVRSLGERLTFYPYSSAIGAIMVPGASAATGLGDFVGKTLAVAGGPLDKSWLITQGAALKGGVDLKARASIVFGAPPLLAEKMRQGEFAGNLNFWNFCAELEASGFRRLIGVDELAKDLGATGQLANLGYVFSEDFASRNGAALTRFLAMTRKAKEILAQSPAEWERLRPRLNLRDDKALPVYRDRYIEGIPRRSVAAEEADARALYGLLAKLGGQELVGKASELSPGTFFRGGPNG